jgi:hypothetical protein
MLTAATGVATAAAMSRTASACMIGEGAGAGEDQGDDDGHAQAAAAAARGLPGAAHNDTRRRVKGITSAPGCGCRACGGGGDWPRRGRSIRTTPDTSPAANTGILILMAGLARAYTDYAARTKRLVPGLW